MFSADLDFHSLPKLFFVKKLKSLQVFLFRLSQHVSEFVTKPLVLFIVSSETSLFSSFKEDFLLLGGLDQLLG